MVDLDFFYVLCYSLCRLMRKNNIEKERRLTVKERLLKILLKGILTCILWIIGGLFFYFFVDIGTTHKSVPVIGIVILFVGTVGVWEMDFER